MINTDDLKSLDKMLKSTIAREKSKTISINKELNAKLFRGLSYRFLDENDPAIIYEADLFRQSCLLSFSYAPEDKKNITKAIKTAKERFRMISDKIK